MSKRPIENPEHYFNRYIACEIKNDGKRAMRIRLMECSLDETLELCQPRELANNLYGEFFEEGGDLLDNIENETLLRALKALTEEQLRLLELICVKGFTQREVARILGVSQKNICLRLNAIFNLIKKYFSKNLFYSIKNG